MTSQEQDQEIIIDMSMETANQCSVQSKKKCELNAEIVEDCRWRKNVRQPPGFPSG